MSMNITPGKTGSSSSSTRNNHSFGNRNINNNNNNTNNQLFTKGHYHNNQHQPRSSSSSSYGTIVFWFTVGVLVGSTITSTWNTSFVVRTVQQHHYDTSQQHVVNELKEEVLLQSSSQQQQQQQQTNVTISTLPLSQLTQRERRIKYQYQPPQQRSTDDLITIANSSNCGFGPDYELYFTQNYKFRSRLNEDRTIYNLFFNDIDRELMLQQNYHYVEIGAFDGIGESNTRFYDTCLGWSGLLIEPNPSIYSRLLENRPYAHRVSFAASCSFDEELVNKTVGFYALPFTNAVQDESDNRWAYAGKRQPVQVPCGSLTPVLLDVFADNQRIHFFSLDTEGVEPMILKNINFEQIFIDVLISENTNVFCTDDTCKSRNETRHIMVNQHGYLLYTTAVEKSDLFVHPKSEFVSKVSHLIPDNDKYKQDEQENQSTSLATSVQTSVQDERRTKYQYHPPTSRSMDDVVTIANSSTCGTVPNYTSFFELDGKVRSRLSEDQTIYNLFFNDLDRNYMIQQNYHYVELGAFDGMGESNTRFFDTCLGWTGLLIEPNPTVYPRLVANRPHAHRVSFAASCSEAEELENKTVGFYASAFTNAVQDESENRAAYAGKRVPVQVPCGSLTPVILDVFADNKRVHFFSLDTEGVEPMIVKNIDFNNIFIDVLISENTNNFCTDDTCKSRKETREIMVKQNGYLLFTNVIKKSDLFVHPKSEFVSKISHLTPRSIN